MFLIVVRIVKLATGSLGARCYVDHCVVNVFVAEQLFDVEDVLSLVVFHSGFPITESVEADA
jgi:hypothetical protein